MGEFIGILHFSGAPLPVKGPGEGVRHIVLIGKRFRCGDRVDDSFPQRQHPDRQDVQPFRQGAADAVQERDGNEGNGTVRFHPGHRK